MRRGWVSWSTERNFHKGCSGAWTGSKVGTGHTPRAGLVFRPAPPAGATCSHFTAGPSCASRLQATHIMLRNAGIGPAHSPPGNYPISVIGSGLTGSSTGQAPALSNLLVLSPQTVVSGQMGTSFICSLLGLSPKHNAFCHKHHLPRTSWAGNQGGKLPTAQKEY